MNELRHSQSGEPQPATTVKHTSSIRALTWHESAADGRRRVTATAT